MITSYGYENLDSEPLYHLKKAHRCLCKLTASMTLDNAMSSNKFKSGVFDVRNEESGLQLNFKHYWIEDCVQTQEIMKKQLNVTKKTIFLRL